MLIFKPSNSLERFINDWLVWYALVVIGGVILGFEFDRLNLAVRLFNCFVMIAIQRILYFGVYVRYLRTPIRSWLEARANG